MQFKPRKEAPELNNKYYKHTSAGGVNKCIHIKNGSCLPNCVGYAWGRWFEILGTEPRLSRANAENWWGHNDGYERGQKPRIGAVMCWRKGQAGNGRDGAGHVAIVEEIRPDGVLITSESDYSGARFINRRREWPYYINGQTFQGFIYPPNNYTAETPQKGPQNVTEAEALKIIAKSVINGKYGNGKERKERIYKAVQNAVNELLK